MLYIKQSDIKKLFTKLAKIIFTLLTSEYCESDRPHFQSQWRGKLDCLSIYYFKYVFDFWGYLSGIPAINYKYLNLLTIIARNYLVGTQVINTENKFKISNELYNYNISDFDWDSLPHLHFN